MRERGALRFVIALAAASAAAVAVTVGCSTFETDEPLPSEAGPDAAADGLAPVSDSEADAAPLRRFCESTDAAFCADFEEGPLKTGFEAAGYENHGLLELEETEGGIPSARVLRATAYPYDGGVAPTPGVGYGALLAKDLLRQGASGIRIELDVRIDSLPPGTFVSFTGLETKLGAAKNDVLVTFQESKGYVLVENRAPFVANNSFDFPLPPKNTWMHMRIDFDLTFSTFTLYTNGNAQILKQIGITGDAIGVTANVGIILAPPALTTAQVAIDNFVLQRF